MFRRSRKSRAKSCSFFVVIDNLLLYYTHDYDILCYRKIQRGVHMNKIEAMLFMAEFYLIAFKITKLLRKHLANKQAIYIFCQKNLITSRNSITEPFCLRIYRGDNTQFCHLKHFLLHTLLSHNIYYE